MCVLELSPNFTWLSIVTSCGPNELILKPVVVKWNENQHSIREIFSLGRKNRHEKHNIHSLPVKCFVFPSLHSLLGASGQAGFVGFWLSLPKGEGKQISWNGQLLLLAVIMPVSVNLFDGADGLPGTSAHLRLHIKDYSIPMDFQRDTSPQFCVDEVIRVC